MPNGSLEKWLHVNDHVLSIMQRLDITIDVASGLEYLHYGYSTPIVHCDLKPSNILLDQDMVGHVCDFGIAKLLGDGESVVQTKTLATFGYIAPDKTIQRKIECISSILQLSLSCTTDAPEERINMKEVLRALQKIKLQFIKDVKP
nr:receptor kinase-like protein Xa21 [Coffea arabica]